MLKRIYFILVLSFAAMSFASGDAHHSDGGIPVNTIIFQFINVGVLVAAMIYFLKDGVKEFFATKHAQFVEWAQKAETAKKQAEEAHLEIQIQLTKLTASADETRERAKAEASDLRKQMLEEAAALSKKFDQKQSPRLDLRLSVQKTSFAKNL
jgi:F-type H+-transporting ATPase subunit b